MLHDDVTLGLTADAWVSGPVQAPQKILLSQKFRQKYAKKFFLNFAQKCKQTAVSQKLGKIKKFFFAYFFIP